MAIIVIDGVPLPDPSEMTWGLQDVSDGDAGRTQDALMHKNRVAQKRKIELKWPSITPDKAAAILTAVNPEYINVTYHDAMTNKEETREFYVGDRSAPVRQWCEKDSAGRVQHWYTSVSFNLIER